MFKKKTITDEDIEKLFDNNDTSVLDDKEEPEEEIRLSPEIFLPDEMDATKEKEIKRVARPEYQASDEFKEKKQQRIEHEEILKNIKNNQSISVLEKTDIRSLDILNAAATTINKFKNDERARQLEKQRILNGGSKLNFDKATKCTYHVYQPREMMGNMMFCACKYCSAYKEMTVDEWKAYQLTIKKYL